jgi:hypothetical protein
LTPETVWWLVKEAHPFVVLSLAILDDEVMTLVVRIDG